MTDSMLENVKCILLSLVTFMNSAKLAGTTRAIGMPSMSIPTRPSAMYMAKRSGRSVCISCGNGERGQSMSDSSMMPVASTLSMSIIFSRRKTSIGSSGSTTPSRYITSICVCDLRPSSVLTDFSRGSRMRRRTSAVFVRSVSTKESLPPLTDFSRLGSEILRAFWLFTSKHTAPSPGIRTAQ